LFIPVETINNA